MNASSEHILDNFFNNKKVIIISDFEGEELKTSGNTNLLICGDILDSTVGGGGDTSQIPISGSVGRFQKIYNIRNILSVVNNNNIKLVLGNRDVNKIKCNILCKINNSQDFNNGNITLSIDDYKKSKELILQNGWIANMKNWAPFWNDSIWNKTIIEKDIEKENKNYKLWCNDNNTDQKSEFPFKIRFDRIFGTDGSVGTMSAGNILYTIPMELFGINKMNTIVNDLDKSTKEDYFAYIVLVTFNAMFNKQIIKNTYKEIDSDTNLSKTYLCGLLNRFYNSNNVIFLGYFNTNKDIYIFSHGGITADLINNAKENKTFIEILKEIIINYKEKLTFTNQENCQKGGNNITNNFSSTTLKNKLNIINKEFKKLLNICLNESYNLEKKIPSENTLLLLALSAQYNPTKDEKRFINYSPIIVGVTNLKKNSFTCDDKTLYQIIGHSPKGYGPTLFTFNNNNKKSYIINIDISQSYKYSGKAGKTTIFLEYFNNIMKLKYTLDFSEDNVKYYKISSLEPQIISQLENHSIQSTTDTKFIIDSDLNNLFNKDDVNKILTNKDIKISGNKKEGIFYHGYTTAINNGKIIHTYMFTLSSKDTGREKDLLLYEQVKSIKSHNGGYYEKYLKYKQKYLQLKQLQLRN